MVGSQILAFSKIFIWEELFISPSFLHVKKKRSARAARGPLADLANLHWAAYSVGEDACIRVRIRMCMRVCIRVCIRLCV